MEITPNGIALFRYPEYDDVTRKLNHDVPGIVVETLHPYAYNDMGPHWVVRTPAESEWHSQEMAVRVDHLTPLDAGVLEPVTRGFVRALLWTDAVPVDMGENGETGGLEDREPTPELTARARLLCARFLTTASADDVRTFMEAFGDPDGGHPGEYVGHTFYLDAAGHGVSFTDRTVTLRDGYSLDDAHAVNAACIRLREIADAFPEVEWLNAYELADGRVDLG